MKIFQGRSAHYSRVILFTVGFFYLSLYLTAGSGVLWAKPSAQDFLMDCYLGTTEEVKKGIEAGADVNAVSPQKYTPLMAAILGKTDSLKKVEMLLAAKADPNIKGGQNSRFTAFNYAMVDTGNNLNLIKLLLGAYTNPARLIKACNPTRRWPDKKQAILLQEILKQGADVHYKGSTGSNALAACASYSGPESLGVLLQAGAKIDDSVALDGTTVLMKAAQYNAHPQSIILLLEHGANPNQLNDKNQTALELSKKNTTPGGPHIQAILRNPDNWKQWNISEKPTGDDLILLAYLGTAEEVKKAIEAGAEVNFVSKQTYTPLIAAVLGQVESLEKVDLLLKAKANPNLKDKHGTTALHEAILHHNNLDIINLLLEAKADVNAISNAEFGKPPLLLAANTSYNNTGSFANGWAPNKQAKLLKLLLENGADASYNSANGSALLEAAPESGPESLRILIEAGIDVNAINQFNGLSALLIAARTNPYPESIQVLLEAGADVTYVPSGDDDILYYAEKNTSVAAEEIKEILREAIKKNKDDESWSFPW